MNLFKGAIGVLKNPGSHREVEFEDPTEAAEAVLLADLLMRILDRIEVRGPRLWRVIWAPRANKELLGPSTCGNVVGPGKINWWRVRMASDAPWFESRPVRSTPQPTRRSCRS